MCALGLGKDFTLPLKSIAGMCVGGSFFNEFKSSKTFTFER